jgi:hypothetical protein
MGRLGVVALDGTKIAANAAPGANRSEKWLRGVARQWLDEAAAADAAEDEAFGAARGDELPAELAEPRGRPARIRQILDELDRERAADTSSRGAQRVDHGAERVRQAQDRLQRARADRQRQVDDRAAREAAAHAAAGRRLSGRTPQGGEQIEGYCRVRDARDALERAEQTYQRATQSRSARTMRNLTDPECRLMPSRSGWLVGYNAQLLVSADHLILAAELTQQPADSQSFPPMLAAATNTLTRVNAAAGTGWRLGCVLADAGYASEENFTCPGPNRLIALGTHHDVDRAARHHATDGPPPAEASPREHMRHRLRTPFGAALYAQRGAIVEPVNAHLKDRRGLRRFSRRGLTAARSELRFAAAITNLLRLHTHLATATG